MYLKERLRERREGEREREIFISWFISQKAAMTGLGWGWARLKPGAWNSILASHVGGRAQALEVLSAILPGTLAGTRMEVEQLGLN